MRTHDAEQHEEAIAHRVASAFLGKLSGRYDVAEVFMFGSRARGDHRPDSDLDLAIVLNGELGRSLNRVQELRLTGDYLADPVPLENAKWAVQEADTFVTEIQRLLTQPKT